MQQRMKYDYAKYDGSFQSWRETMESSNIGIVNSINQLMKGGNLTDAFSLITNLDASNTQEENYKTVYTIYLHHLITDSAYSSSDSITLYNIAILNPLTNGNAVYMSRNILFLEIEDSLLISNERKAKFQRANKDLDIKIYPNPASEEISLLANENLNGYTYFINDLSSRTIFSGIYKNKIAITGTESGIYFIQLKKDDLPSYQSKFTIIKK